VAEQSGLIKPMGTWILERLKNLGVQFAMDDFGTGFSSLSYLRSLPIDQLKIDKAFIDGVTGSPDQSALVRAVIQLAHTFDLKTVAEGVEREDQCRALQMLGSDFGQGLPLLPATRRPEPGGSTRAGRWSRARHARRRS